LALSRDHKPSDDNEKKRIIENGGHIYQNNQVINPDKINEKMNLNAAYGPLRVLPGRLSVSRTFGDCLAKLE